MVSGYTAAKGGLALPLPTLFVYALPAVPLAALALPVTEIVPSAHATELGAPIATASNPLIGFTQTGRRKQQPNPEQAWNEACRAVLNNPGVCLRRLVLLGGIEPPTSPLPRECSTTELQQRNLNQAAS